MSDLLHAGKEAELLQRLNIAAVDKSSNSKYS